MKKIWFSLLFFSFLWLPFISYWNDCSVYDELMSTIDAQMSSLKIRAMNEYAARNNSSVNSYAAYTESQITQAVYNSKYWDEMRSLKAEYDKAVKDKENCLSNSSSSSSASYSDSSSSSYSDSSSTLKYTATSSDGSSSMDVTELYKILVDAWFDEYHKNDYVEAINYFLQSYDLCTRVKWYNSKMDESCETLPKILSNMYWLAGGQSFKNKNYNEAKTFYAAWIKYDSKDVWLYVWLWNIAYIEWDYSWAIEHYSKWKKYETDQEKLKKIEKYISDCEKSLWNGNQNSEVAVDNLTTKLENMNEWETLDVSVQCDEWYIIDETQTKCVKDSLDQRKLNCTTWFWENSELSKENNDDCVCKEWYMMNASETKCIPYSIEQMKANCEIWYWEHSIVTEVTKCKCEEGYTWSYDETFCDVDLDQKSLSSRMLNTLDAKCDTDSVINSCKDDPTGDACPAVCLEIYDAINWMYDNELTIYKDPKQFGIYNEMTREQASKFFVNFYKTVFNKTLAVPMKNPFNDIDNADPTLYRYIQYAFWLNLFKGNNWKFMPFNHLSKAQSLAVIIRMPYWLLDETVNPWYMNYLYKWESLKLLDNIKYSQSTLDSEDILRGDVALMLYRLYIYLTYLQ